MHAWPLFRTPPSNALIPLMNSAFLLESKGFEKRDIELMAALSLISGRKFIQACEIFKRIQADILAEAKSDQLNSLDLERCIQLELLIADSMNQHSQMREKIYAY